MEQSKATLLLVMTLLATHAVGAQDPLTQPFAVENQNPFVHLSALMPHMSASLAPSGQTAWAASYTLASHFEVGQAGNEQILIDGETERVVFAVSRTLSSGWELGVELPVIRHSEGYLDDLIVDWHDWFDLPQNGRDIAAQDRLGFIYSTPGEQIAIVDSVSGLGDVRLRAGRALYMSSRSASSWRLQIKLPTGEHDELLGSGGLDLGLSVQHEQLVGTRLLWGASAAVNYHSEGDVLPDYVRPFVAQLGARVAYKVSPRVALKMQWDAHSQVYERTRLRQLNEIAYILSFGASMRIGARGVLDLVVVENYPHPEISPDVAFQLRFKWLTDSG